MNMLLTSVELLYDSAGLEVHSKNRTTGRQGSHFLCNYTAFKSAQHAAQRVAAIGIAAKQCGQSFFPGSFFRILLAIFTIRKITSAMIKKLTTSLRKAP